MLLILVGSSVYDYCLPKQQEKAERKLMKTRAKLEYTTLPDFVRFVYVDILIAISHLLSSHSLVCLQPLS